MSSNYVLLTAQRNLTWPWPSNNWDRILDGLYGTEGWCRNCGRGLVPRRGDLTLELKTKALPGAWMPYLIPDLVCVGESLGHELATEFGVEVRDAHVHRNPDLSVGEIVPTLLAESTFSRSELSRLTSSVHGRAGDECALCGQWRWMPLTSQNYAMAIPSKVLADQDLPVVAGPDLFGSGFSTRHVSLYRADVAESIAAGSRGELAIVRS